MEEYLDYKELQIKMKSLKQIFDDYNNLLGDMDKQVDSKMGGDDPAIISKLGDDFLGKWTENTDSFFELKIIFENLYQKVASLSKNTENFEDEVIKLFQEEGAGNDGTTGGKGVETNTVSQLM